MKNENEKEQIPFPSKLVGWFDIVAGLGQTAVDVLIHRHKSPTPSEHFRQPELPYNQFDLWEDLSPVQKDANQWVEKIGFEED